MTNQAHDLTRNQANEPICRCGYRPEILDELAPVGKQWKAKQIVLDHADALNLPQAAPRRSPDGSFRPGDFAKYPRAGVRRLPDGQWWITLWDQEGVMHAWDDPAAAKHGTRFEAFTFAWMLLSWHRVAGTRLNGMGA